MDEELLDYEDDMEEPVIARQRVVMAGDVPGVVQGGHAKAHRREVSAGNLLRGGFDVISRRQDDAVCFVMQQIEAGLAAVTISGCVGGPDKMCAVWIVGHSFVRWAEKQA
ncbi:hypothetical protein NDU88_002735 [Pleurodeles waltl]|uniref:Uncharacterized protein n=1 Tax=Pleurodeles waltl TaxID=8319 RepID=A0AAV7RB71_PLEWA|nr:hypothetical protein NDU88_002735 [Pleurodeles waltl]